MSFLSAYCCVCLCVCVFTHFHLIIPLPCSVAHAGHLPPISLPSPSCGLTSDLPLYVDALGSWERRASEMRDGRMCEWGEAADCGTSGPLEGGANSTKAWRAWAASERREMSGRRGNIGEGEQRARETEREEEREALGAELEETIIRWHFVSLPTSSCLWWEAWRGDWARASTLCISEQEAKG